MHISVVIRIFTVRDMPHAGHFVEQLPDTFNRYSIIYILAAAAHSEYMHGKAERDLKLCTKAPGSTS